MISASRRFVVPAFALLAAFSVVHAQDAAPLASPAASPVANTAATPKPPKTVWSDVRVSQPYIALTFDDGPHPFLTPRLLDTLKAKGIHATFFCVGQNAKEYPGILKRAVAEGHEIANHSWSHPNFAKMSDEAVKSELNRTSDAIEAATGKRPTLMRPPYGSFTKAQGKWFHDELGFTVVLWDVDPDDWRDPGPAVVEDRVLNGWKESTGVRHGSIVLSHDIHKGTVEAEPEIIDKLIEKGYKFVTVSELIAMNEPEPVPTPKPSATPGGSVKPKSSRPPATPKPTVDPSLPKKIDGTSTGL